MQNLIFFFAGTSAGLLIAIILFGIIIVKFKNKKSDG